MGLKGLHMSALSGAASPPPPPTNHTCSWADLSPLHLDLFPPFCLLTSFPLPGPSDSSVLCPPPQWAPDGPRPPPDEDPGSHGQHPHERLQGALVCTPALLLHLFFFCAERESSLHRLVPVKQEKDQRVCFFLFSVLKMAVGRWTFHPMSAMTQRLLQRRLLLGGLAWATCSLRPLGSSFISSAAEFFKHVRSNRPKLADKKRDSVLR